MANDRYDSCAHQTRQSKRQDLDKDPEEDPEVLAPVELAPVQDNRDYNDDHFEDENQDVFND
jgi:hypothetical protein